MGRGGRTSASRKSSNGSDGGKEDRKASSGNAAKNSRKLLVTAATVAICIVAVVGFIYRSSAPANSKSASSESNSTEARPDILLISLDTLRADRLGCYGYASAQTPTIDAWAAGGLLFESAQAPAPITLPSHSSMLTGLIPPEHGVRLNSGYELPASVESIAETLKSNGYQTGGFVSAIPLLKSTGLAQGFDHYDDNLNTLSATGAPVERSERYAEETLAAARQWLEKVDSTRPVFIFIHLFDAHEPYEKPLPGESQPSYDGEIAYIDRSLGQFFNALKGDKNDRWSKMARVLTADHGESLGEHGETTHGFFAYESTLHVPLIVSHTSSLKAGRVRQAVGTPDVAPTILALANLEPRAGHSLLPLVDQSQNNTVDRPLYFECLVSSLQCGWAPLKGIRVGSLKYISAPTPELYDLAADPKEQNNLFAAQPDNGHMMQEQLASITSDRKATARTDPESLKRLEGLGYIAYTPTREQDTSGKADPKDRIAAFEKLLNAHRVYIQQNYAEALSMMASLEPLFPDSPFFHIRYGDYASQVNDWQKARIHYRRVLELDPLNEKALLNQAVALYRCNDLEASFNKFELLLKRKPNHVKGLWAMGRLCVTMHKTREAIKYISQFLEIAPGHPDAANMRQTLERLKAES